MEASDHPGGSVATPPGAMAGFDSLPVIAPTWVAGVAPRRTPKWAQKFSAQGAWHSTMNAVERVAQSLNYGATGASRLATGMPEFAPSGPCRARFANVRFRPKADITSGAATHLPGLGAHLLHFR